MNEIIKSQQNCKYIKQAIDYILQNKNDDALKVLPKGYTKNKSMQLIINNNMLCRIIVDSRSKVQTQVLIPNEDTKVQELLLIGFHDNLLAEHFGFTRTLSQLARQYH
jgi:hypothetical protein